jgi:phage gp36-like protein
LKSKIKDNVINDTTENDSTLLDTIELCALSEVRAYISHYYDLDLEFTLTSSARNYFLVKIIVDIMLYEISTRLTPNNIPQVRKDRYDAAVVWLTQVSQGKLAPNVPIRDVKYEPTSERGGLKGGSYSKINSQF